MFEEFELLPSPEAEENDFQKKFSERLDEASLEISEIEKTRPVIERGIRLINDEFGLFPELLDKPHSLYLIALAQRYGNLEETQDTDGISSDYVAEKEFIFDATALVANKKSNLYEKYAKLIDPEPGISEEERSFVYEKFTNAEATAELNEAIKNGFLDDVKQRLGVSTENEDPYELRVLNVGDVSVMHGLEPYDASESDGTSFDDSDKQEYNDNIQKYIEYQDSLVDNSVQFKSELHSKGDIAAAWTTTINGVRTIILPLPVVVKLLHHNEKCNVGYTENDYSKDKAIFEHEYVHSQGHVNLDKDTFLGITGEELRAENFSGRKQGYGDVKALDLLLQMISATDVSSEMKSNEKGGTPEGLFKYLANKIGLQRALEFSLTPPSEYLDKEQAPLLFSINEHLGGLDGLVSRLYEDAIKGGRTEAISDNFGSRAKAVVDSFQTNDVSFFYDKMKNISKMPFGAELFRKKFEALGARY